MSGRRLVAILVATTLLAAGCGSQPAEREDLAGEAERLAEEYCLEGELDLGARFQGLRPEAGEPTPTTWCVISEPEGPRVRFQGAGRSNPDVESSFTVVYLAPDRVRIVNADSPPDIEFRGALAGPEAGAVRRLDPRRLIEELDANPDWIVDRAASRLQVRWPGSDAPARIEIDEGPPRRPRTISTFADLPLRGRVPVVWRWRFDDSSSDGALEVIVDGETLFRGVGRRRQLSPAEAAAVWQPSGDQPPREVAGKAWPAVVAMRVETLSPGVHRVRGVRTGFAHLVVETASGLVVADAPAGWLELHQLPPFDLVPGLGPSGLSERFVDFLSRQWPDAPIRAVVLTHAHDDHAGGARAFAAAGAEIYAPAESAGFLEESLNRSEMPADRLAASGRSVIVRPVAERLVLADPERPVEMLPITGSPHVEGALGVWVPAAGVFFQSDLLVPGDEEPEPRPDRLGSECWFARWATAALPPETMVLNSHTPAGPTVEVLTRYLESEGCRGGSQ